MKKRSVRIAGHQTSITLEEPFWSGLKVLAQKENLSINQLITHIDETRTAENLSSAIRLFVFSQFLNDEQKALLQDAL